MARSGPEIVLARHGETEWSLSGQHTGSSDIPLTENGRDQARALATRLADRDFAAVLSSPLVRALETARLSGQGDDVQIRRDLLEWDYGEYEGVTTKEIRKTAPDWLLWRDGCPGGENAEDVGARADSIIAELRGIRGDAAVFAHGHILRVLGARWLGQPAGLGSHLGLTTATLSVLGWEREVPVIWTWNDDAHLRGATADP